VRQIQIEKQNYVVTPGFSCFSKLPNLTLQGRIFEIYVDCVHSIEAKQSINRATVVQLVRVTFVPLGLASMHGDWDPPRMDLSNKMGLMHPMY
jgi:hypothetical protein